MKTFLALVTLVLLLGGAAAAKKASKKAGQKSKFLIGRIPPGRFEYPQLNGYFSPKEAARVCEADAACAGFTFKGTANSPKASFETYFFHFVPKELFEKGSGLEQFYHWTSYRVTTRDFVELRHYRIKSPAQPPIACLDNRYQDLARFLWRGLRGGGGSGPLCLSSYVVRLFQIILFLSTTLLSGVTGISLHLAMASDFSVAFLTENNCFVFLYASNSTHLSY
jgi:hypothetical protein